MPSVSVRLSPRAHGDTLRLHKWLSDKSPLAAKKALEQITKSLEILKQQPKIGRPADWISEEFRELVIPFGASGYLALYQFDESANEAVVVAIRHQKEAGYPDP